MAWENIEERLKEVLQVKISFPSGTVWLPDTHVTIDDWLTSLPRTDEELKELNIPRIRFLQNRWRIEKLLQIKWERPSDHRSIWTMYVGRQAYILFSNGVEYQVIAAIAPNNRPKLYRVVIDKLLRNPNFVPEHPTSVKSYRPDLTHVDEDSASGIKMRPVLGGENCGGLGGPIDWMHPGSRTAKIERGMRWKRFLSEIFVGWIGRWLSVPEIGFWHHEEMPDSISRSGKGTIVMKYKPTYGDKQREAQKLQRKEELRNRQLETEKKPVSDEPKNRESPPDEKKRVA